MPDLVIIDGGKGQVSAAKEVLDELGLHDLPLAGLAKEREELFLPGRADPIVLPATSPALTSSSACATRRTGSRSPTTATCGRSAPIRSAFDDLPGVGPKRKRALLRVFGSTKRVREAPVEQIAAVPGHRRARWPAGSRRPWRPDASRRSVAARAADAPSSPVGVGSCIIRRDA